MNKTIHKKLTESYTSKKPATLQASVSAEMQNGTKPLHENDFTPELNLLRESAKELLQPRTEAVARLLELAKSI